MSIIIITVIIIFHLHNYKYLLLLFIFIIYYLQHIHHYLYITIVLLSLFIFIYFIIRRRGPVKQLLRDHFWLPRMFRPGPVIAGGGPFMAAIMVREDHLRQPKMIPDYFWLP